MLESTVLAEGFSSKKTRNVSTALLIASQLFFLWAIFSASSNPFSKLFLFAVALGFIIVLILSFDLAIRLFIFSLVFNYHFFEGWGVTLSDLLALILVVHFFFRVIVTREITLRSTPIDKALFVFLFIIGLSLTYAPNLKLGLVNYARHLELFLTFYAIYHCLEQKQIVKVIKFFLIVVGLNGILALGQFIKSGGTERVFGEAGNAFADMLVPSFILAYILYTYQRKMKNRVLLACMLILYFLSLLATGTRGALVSLTLTFIVANIALVKSKALTAKTAMKILGALAVTILVFLAIFGYRTSHTVITPHQNLIQIETIEIRFVLWYMALKLFLANPVLGIGLNQFLDTVRVFPSAKNSPFLPYIEGMDAHSTVLNYLVNTGLLGTLALLFLFCKILKVAWMQSKLNQNTRVEPFAVGMAVMLTYVVFSSFYAGMWFWSLTGFEFVFFLALAVKNYEVANLKGT